MKITQEQRIANRRAIIRESVDLMIEKGFKAATMREIARQAQIGEATIYNYFPTKEAILFAYYEDHVADCIEALKNIEKFNTWSFQEQLQTFFETSLERYLPDREFVHLSYKPVFFSFSHQFRQLDPIRQPFLKAVRDMLEAAVEVGELPPPVFSDLVVQLFWDHYIAVVAYWLADTSKQFTDTTLLLDKSIDLASALLKSGVANKVFDMGVLLFKTHVLNRLPVLRDAGRSAAFTKRSFTGGRHDG